jgi:hypothetical protein
MLKKKTIYLVLFLILSVGCAHDPNIPVPPENIRLSPGAERTVCIQPDPTQPEMALIVKPLEKRLKAKGYKIVATPDEAVHTIRLHINVFGIYATSEEAEKAAVIGSHTGSNYPTGSRPPGVAHAAGTAVGGAASGNVLHAATTTGGAVGGVVGMVVDSLLSSGSTSGKLFYAAVDVRISDPVSEMQHTVLGTRVRPLDPNNPMLRSGLEQMAAHDLAYKVAALMP